MICKDMASVSTATQATTAHYNIAARNHVSSEKNYPVSVLFLKASLDAQVKRCRRLVVVRSSGDGVETTAATEAEPESPVEVLPSLISALNVERALRGLPITEADHYGRLGLRTGCSYDEVTTAYKNKVEEIMNRGLDEEEASEELELLKESHSILSSVEERRLYDWSLGRSGKPDRYVWPYEVDITQTITGTPPPREPEDEGPTRLVGYFFLGWLILSFVLFIILNRLSS